MPPTLILIRHAQALHNVAQDYQLHDPPLTTLGFGPQCDELAKYLENDLPLAQEAELIVVSPMRRTLQTAQQGVGFLIKKGVPVILRADWQENSANPCDIGTPIKEMEKEWPQFDWSTVDPVFPKKEGLYAHSKDGLTTRGIEAKKWLKNRPEKVIVVVTHSGFLRVGVCNRQFANADFRVFDFASADDDDVDLKEWDLTEQRGGGLGKSPIGVFVMDATDYPEEPGAEVGEVANEEP